MKFLSPITAPSLDATGALKTTSTVDASSISTGSIQTLGGVGITKNLFVGGNGNIAGTLSVTGTITGNLTGSVTGASSLNVLKTGDTISGALTVTGAITGNLTGSVTGASSLNVLKAGDTMTGNLTVNSPGTVTYTVPLQAFAPSNTTVGNVTEMRVGTAGSNYNSAEVRFVNDGGSGSISNYMELGLFGANGLNIYGNSNVGVGTLGTDPVAKFEVANQVNTANTWDSVLARSANAADTNFRLVAKKGASTNGVGDVMVALGMGYASSLAVGPFIRFHRASTQSDGFMSFSTNNDTERMRIDNAGKVSISTTTASTSNTTGALVVAGGIASSGGDIRCAGGLVASGGCFTGGDSIFAGSLTVNTGYTNASYTLPVSRGAAGTVLMSNGGTDPYWSGAPVDSGWVNGSVTSGWGGSIRARKINGTVVIVDGTISKGGNNVGNGVLCTLPAGFAPPRTIALIAINKENVVATGLINTSGQLNFLNGTNSQDLFFNFTFGM